MVQPTLADTPVGPLEISGPVPLGSQVLLGFRPESVSAVSASPVDGRNVLNGRLRSSTFLGDQFLYDVMIRDYLFVGKGRMIPAHADGHLCLYVNPADIMVFPAAKRLLPQDVETAMSSASG